MKKNLLLAAFTLACAVNAIGPVHAQVAGATTTSIAITETSEIAAGWSVKKTILGKPVFDENGGRIGKVEDLIVNLQKNVSYLIVGAGGFVGLGRHDVAIPIGDTQEKDGRLVVRGATKESIKAMPVFHYAVDATARDRFVSKVEQDIAKTRADVNSLEKKAMVSQADVKQRLERDIAAVRVETKATEDKLTEMKRAGASRWKEFETEVSASAARMRKSLATAMA